MYTVFTWTLEGASACHVQVRLWGLEPDLHDRHGVHSPSTCPCCACSTWPGANLKIGQSDLTRVTDVRFVEGQYLSLLRPMRCDPGA